MLNIKSILIVIINIRNLFLKKFLFFSDLPTSYFLYFFLSGKDIFWIFFVALLAGQ